jgi:hypothetical protein
VVRVAAADEEALLRVCSPVWGPCKPLSNPSRPLLPGRCGVVPASKSFCRPRLASTERSTPSSLLIVDLVVLAAIAQMIFVDLMLRMDTKSPLHADQRWALTDSDAAVV